MTGSREIAEALRALPIIPEREGEIEAFAQQIALASIAAGIEELPGARTGGTKRAEEDLLTFGKRCRDLGEHIQAMRRESREALAAHLGNALDPDRLFIELSRSLEAVRRAYHSLPAEDSEGMRGRIPKHRERAVTEKAAEAYERLTGRRATYSTELDTNRFHGPFPEFIAVLFDRMQISASAETHVKSFIRGRNARELG